MKHGALAVAIVQHQVMVVKAVRSHTKRDRLLDVCTYTPIGDCLFLATDVPNARISVSDILTMFPSQHCSPNPSSPPTITSNSSDTLIDYEEDPSTASIKLEMLELPAEAFNEFVELCSRNQKRHEKLWVAGTGLKVKGKLLRFR